MGNGTVKTDKCQLSTVNSQLREGYKQTDVGVIPDGYRMIKMGALPVDWEKLEAQICVF